MKDTCHTRWGVIHTFFFEILPAVHMTLEALTCPCHYENLGTDLRWDGETLTKVNAFVYHIVSFPFWSVLGFYL